MIVLNGFRAGVSNGLSLAPGSNNSTIRGLAIQQFSSAGLELSGTSGNVIQGDFIGTDKTGTVKLGNAAGIEIHNGATNNTIGGTTTGAGNVISGASNSKAAPTVKPTLSAPAVRFKLLSTTKGV